MDEILSQSNAKKRNGSISNGLNNINNNSSTNGNSRRVDAQIAKKNQLL